MLIKTSIFLVVCCIGCLITELIWAFTEHDDDFTESSSSAKKHEPLPKDKILLRDVKILTFHRNKKTTAKRTNSLSQLTCVGGTAGCKLFTPNVVECENIGFDNEKRQFNWRCHADMSNRVIFNHVEVICEGYDYPEDDYILLGSCGLEFTLDYSDPHDYHDNSYFRHMDDHEKELHKEKISTSTKSKLNPSMHIYVLILSYINSFPVAMIAFIVILALCFLLVKSRFFSASINKDVSQGKKTNLSRGSSYAHLTTAVLNTKKAC